MALYPNSLVYGVAFGDRLDSTACTSASIELVANTPKGSPSRSCGNEHRRVRIHGRPYQPHLRPQAGPVQN